MQHGLVMKTFIPEAEKLFLLQNPPFSSLARWWNIVLSAGCRNRTLQQNLFSKFEDA